MPTFPCTVKEFNRQYMEFRKAMIDSKSTQDEVALAYKCLVLHYLGLPTENYEELDGCAIVLQSASMEAFRRGWHLIEPELSVDRG